MTPSSHIYIQIKSQARFEGIIEAFFMAFFEAFRSLISTFEKYEKLTDSPRGICIPK